MVGAVGSPGNSISATDSLSVPELQGTQPSDAFSLTDLETIGDNRLQGRWVLTDSNPDVKSQTWATIKDLFSLYIVNLKNTNNAGDYKKVSNFDQTSEWSCPKLTRILCFPAS